MIELLITYNEENDERDYEWSYNLEELLETMSIPKAIEKAREEFLEAHPYAYAYNCRLEFPSARFMKYSDGWKRW